MRDSSRGHENVEEVGESEEIVERRVLISLPRRWPTVEKVEA